MVPWIFCQALLFGLPQQYSLAESELPPAALPKDKIDEVESTQEALPDEPPKLSTSPPGAETLEEEAVEKGAVDEGALIPQRSPGQLLRSLFATSLKNRIPGQPRSLADILGDAGGLGEVGADTLSRHEQTARIQAYWDLSAAIAQDTLAQLERIELQALHAGIQTPDAGWQQVFAENQDHSHLTRRAALVAQYKLQQLTSDIRPQMTIADEGLPIPVDHPHCGVYDTRYDQIFQNRPSEFAWQLHGLLGNQHQQLVRLAEAVESATIRRQQVSRQRPVQSNGSELLRAHENLRLQRRQFMAAVHTYNRTIADYTQLALPKSINARQLVAILIYVEPSEPSDQESREAGQDADQDAGQEAGQEGHSEIERTSGELDLLSQSNNGLSQSNNGLSQSNNGLSQSNNGLSQSNNGPSQSSNSREHSILVPSGR
jgi:hypothetical protein